VPTWAAANRHAGVFGCVTARRSAGMSAALTRCPRSRMTSFPCRQATTLRDRQSFRAVSTDLRPAPIHSARSASLRLTCGCP
jgi:hypothetical protein